MQTDGLLPFEAGYICSLPKTEMEPEKEAALSALLEQMGFGETAVVVGAEAVSVIAPWQAAENERSRMQIIDAAASQTGFSAERIKIILAKK